MVRSLSDHLDPNQGPKRILVLDGGGVKGVLTLGLLAEIERELRSRSGDRDLVLSDFYDLIGGSESGAVIAAGLALGMPVDALTETYLKISREMFRSGHWLGWIGRSRTHPDMLKSHLGRMLGDRRMSSPDLRTGLAVLAKRLDTGSAWVLTNHPRPRTLRTGARVLPLRLLDVVSASVATTDPTQAARLVTAGAYGDGATANAETGYYLNSATSAANDPSLNMLLIALLPEFDFCWSPGVNALMMTSCGAGLRRPRVSGSRFRTLSLARRSALILRSMTFDAKLQGIALLQAMSNPVLPWFVSSELGGMFESMMTQEYLLDYQRLDVRLEKAQGMDESRSLMCFAEDLLARALSDSVIADLDGFYHGASTKIDLLHEIGRAAGSRLAGPDYPNPHFNLPEWATVRAATGVLSNSAAPTGGR